jgi:hypothetical protein
MRTLKDNDEFWQGMYQKEVLAGYRFTILILISAALLLVGLLFLTLPALAHEHQPGESRERAEILDWLQTWRRPSGQFAGIPHRHDSCCYVSGDKQDCFAVKATRVVDGVREVFPDSEGHFEYDQWYKLNTGVTEADQKDPRDSPDGRSYVCIHGESVICYVDGSGM